MAISNVQPLLLLLLASLFFLPTLHGVAFKNCGSKSSPVNVTSVDVVGRRGRLGFQISGYTSKTITRGYMVANLVQSPIKGAGSIVRSILSVFKNVFSGPGAFSLMLFSREIGFLPPKVPLKEPLKVPQPYNTQINVYNELAEQIICVLVKL